ncbi:ferric reductase like transmembrane component [Colletotrichum zoysiae]|uniref:Ferric reductase like transmembrane component n=1 Tax=Colletotrichum zoysiae TaxID=1216348 RepID=A0AAD9H977_9PEZI|nr:ferric reductase like transmembrane component [Colletotrichum zoysiae]
MDFHLKSQLAARHIQDFSDAASLEPHWGYSDRVVPCTNDAGSCAYLDVVYDSHDLGMLYSGILWIIIGGILLVWAVGRRALPSRSEEDVLRAALLEDSPRSKSFLNRLRQAISSGMNRYLLPDFIRPIFGRTTRLQVLILAVLSGYLLIFSFVGIVYNTWITPVKNMPGVYNTRSVMHTIGWLVIEVRLYQPQPKVAVEWITQLYMIWGCIALLFIMALYVLSLPPVIRLTGYEFFRKSHYILAMLLECFMIPALIIWFLDRAARAIRTALIHHNFIEDSENGDVVRLDFSHPHDAWSIGQHFYLCFTESSIWQSHPFTPLNAPVTVNGRTKHSYIFRAKGGETRKVVEIAKRKLATVSEDQSEAVPATSVILTGPYGDPILHGITSDVNILCVAGGTGVTYVLPALMSLQKNSGASRKLELIWVVRHIRDVEWIKPELDSLEAGNNPKVVVRVFAKRDADSSVSSPRQSNNLSESGSTSDAREHVGEKQVQMTAETTGDITSSDAPRHPDMTSIVHQFVETTVSGRTAVFASGPGGLMSDIRVAVAHCNVVVYIYFKVLLIYYKYLNKVYKLYSTRLNKKDVILKLYKLYNKLYIIIKAFR